MANKYHIYVGGTLDTKTLCYSGGTLDATFDTEREAFYHEKKLQWEFKKGVYMTISGDERFKIVPCSGMGLNYAIVSKRDESVLIGACVTLEDAIAEKARCEKFHIEHWYKEYYDQFKAA